MRPIFKLTIQTKKWVIGNRILKQMFKSELTKKHEKQERF